MSAITLPPVVELVDVNEPAWFGIVWPWLCGKCQEEIGNQDGTCVRVTTTNANLSGSSEIRYHSGCWDFGKDGAA